MNNYRHFHYSNICFSVIREEVNVVVIDAVVGIGYDRTTIVWLQWLLVVIYCVVRTIADFPQSGLSDGQNHDVGSAEMKINHFRC